jgi:hypothetical protein
VELRTNQAAADYSLANPDTLTKYKTAAQISHKALETVTEWCVEGAKILTICEKGDKLLDEEVAKVYKGKKIAKGELNRSTRYLDKDLTAPRHFPSYHSIAQQPCHTLHTSCVRC